MQVPLGSTVGDVEVFSDTQGQPTYYVVHLLPKGFVIVPADDLVEPIVCFANEEKYDTSPRSPLYALVSRDLAHQVALARRQPQAGITAAPQDPLALSQAAAKAKWEWLTGTKTFTGPGMELMASISDVRVVPLVQSTWSQGVVGDIDGEPACYNYYTPPGPDNSQSNYPCGCVATCMAQLMRYHRHPTTGIGKKSFDYTVDGHTASGYTKGGDGSGAPYNWDQMPLQPSAATTLAQRKQIGSLCWDAGIAVQTEYATDGSAALMSDAAAALKSTFGYSGAISGDNRGSNIGASMPAMINPGLDAGYPSLLGVYNPDSGSGHAIVVDGYGYNGSTLYHHLNMGWSGDSDVWYNLPDIDDATDPYNVVDGCVYNVFTSGTGELISGRVTSPSGVAINGAAVTATRSGSSQTYTATTNGKGIYALGPVPSNSTFSISVTADGSTFTNRTVTTGISQNDSTICGNRWKTDFVAGAGSTEPTTYTLTILVSGTSTDAPAPETYPAGSYATVTTPDPLDGAIFDHWSGDIGGATATDPSIEIVMDADKTVTANYLANSASQPSHQSGTSCGQQVGPVNLIAFYCMCWLGLGAVKLRPRLRREQ